MSGRRLVLMSLLALALGGAASVLVACGDRNGLIPRAQGDAIKTDLDKAASNFDAQECRAAQTNVQDASDKVLALPRSVDTKLRQNLGEGVKSVGQDVVDTCGKTTTTTTTPTVTTDTTPTDTTTTDTTTTDTTTTDTTTTDTTTTGTTTDGTSGGTPVGPGTGSAGGQSGNSGEQKNFKVRSHGRGKVKGDRGGGGD